MPGDVKPGERNGHPERRSLVEPAARQVHGGDREAEAVAPPFPPSPEQARLLQDLHVAGDRRQRHAMVGGELAHGPGPLGQPAQHVSPERVGEG